LADKRYNLLEWPTVPISQRADKVIPAKHSAKRKQEKRKIPARAELLLPREWAFSEEATNF
jgi:hypothetical protein